MTLKLLSNQALLESTHHAVKLERSWSLKVIENFQEINDRRLYLQEGYSSLFDMMTKAFGYSAAAAQRRIESMRLIQDVKEVGPKIESGEISLCVTASLQTFFKMEAKENKSYSKEEKLELIEQCQGKSYRAVEKELASRNPSLQRKDSLRYISADRLRLTTDISEELQQKLDRIKSLLSHKNPDMGGEELLDAMAEICLDKLDPTRKKSRKPRQSSPKPPASIPASEAGQTLQPEALPTSEVGSDLPLRVFQTSKTSSSISSDAKATSSPAHPTPPSFPAPETNQHPPLSKSKRSRYIPKPIRQEVWKLNQDQGCVFEKPETHQRCGSQHLLQIDHIHPYSKGGQHELKNLRLLCSQHNRWAYRHPEPGLF